MASIGTYLKSRRNAKGLTLRELAELSGVSHTEIYRVESGQREHISIRVLIALGRTLDIPDEEILHMAGYNLEDDDSSMMEKVFPELKTEKQQDTAQRIIDGLARNNDLQNTDYDDLVDHMEMFFDHVKKKRNTKNS